MAKEYTIVGELMENLDDLLYFLKNSYSEAFSYFSDQKFYNKRMKELKSFVKNQDRELGEVINEIITNTKNLNNVLSYIIFELSSKEDVYISGKRYSFNEFLATLRTLSESNNFNYENNVENLNEEDTSDADTNEEDSNEDNLNQNIQNEELASFKIFIANHGITRTYAKIIDSPYFYENMLFVENNIDNGFVYNYLITYNDDFKNAASFVKTIVTGIAIRNEECFYTSYQEFCNQEFLLALAHRIDQLSPVVDAIRSDSYVFKVCKILGGSDIDNETLLKLCTNSFFDWLLNNFNNYKYKGQAKSTKSILASKLKEYNKLSNNFNIENLDDFNKLVDIENELYNIYLDFANQYKEGLIIAKEEVFELKIEYASTLICQNYMDGIALNLDHLEIHKDPSLDTTFAGIVHYDVELTKKKNKLYRKLHRIGFITTVFSTISLIVSIVFIVLSIFLNYKFPNLFLESGISIASGEIYDSTILLAALSLVSLIFGGIIRAKSTKGIKNVLNYVSYNHFKVNSDKLTKDQAKLYKKLSKKSAKLESRLNTNYRIFSALLCVVLTITFSVFFINILGLIVSLSSSEIIVLSINLTEMNYSYMHLILGVVLALIYGIIKKGKGVLSYDLLFVFGLLSVIVGCFINI